MRKLTVAMMLLAAAPVAAQLPSAPRPVRGGPLDGGRSHADSRPSKHAKRLPKAPAWISERPGWVRTDPRVVATFTGDDVAKREGTRVRDGVATRSLDHPGLTWWSSVKAIPPQSQACVTVYLKLHRDFRPGDGGKLPGFANTGLGRRYSSKPEMVNGRELKNTGWGGRKTDGVHWSARSGFGDWDDQGVALRTYFYAMEPRNLWGHIDRFGELPKGEWSAYVQCVKLNTPGRPDGGLYYEVVRDGARYARNDIRWRDEEAPESRIRELWLDFYCGGTKCGNGPRGTISFAKAVVTKGLPDMADVKKTLARLDRTAA